MRHPHLLPILLLVSLIVAFPAAAQTPGGGEDAKIASAVSAAPPSIADDAAVMDWPAEAGGAMTELRPGTNGWACMPDLPATPGDDPMCLDANFQALIAAWQGKTEPDLEAVGFGYMLLGGTDASNTDPFATEPAPGEEWIETPPHVMMAVPDLDHLEGLPTDPANGGPWVMWKGTPYAHIMMPLGEKTGHAGHQM